MPLYFFHLCDGVDILLDHEGQDVGDADVVAAIALREARAIIAEDARSGTILLDRHIQVADEAGAIVHELRFADAVRIVALPELILGSR